MAVSTCANTPFTAISQRHAVLFCCSAFPDQFNSASTAVHRAWCIRCRLCASSAVRAGGIIDNHEPFRDPSFPHPRLAALAGCSG
ncbi:MAG: hypothetical protein ABSG90_02420 [Dehalococcoidia bacterium]